MKKELVLPGLAVLGGAAGFALRLWQRSAAVDPWSGIVQLTHPATLGLIALSVLLALVLLVLVQKAGDPEEPARPFVCPSSVYMTLMASAGLLLLAAGGLGLMQTLSSYQQLRAEVPLDVPVAFPAMEALCAILCLPAGASALIFGRYNYRGTESPFYPLSSLAPGYLGLIQLIAFYVDHSNDPLLLRYVWSLLGWVTTLAALYLVSSCCFRRPAPRGTLFFSGAAVCLQLLSLADGPALNRSIVSMALALYLLAQSAALGRNSLGRPRMPSGAQENDRTENEEKQGE